MDENYRKVTRNIVSFLLFAWVLTACLPAPLSQETTNVLFQDDFSSQNAGWDQLEDTDGLTGYQNGAYRIQVLQPFFDYWSNPNIALPDGNVQVDVDAVKIAGPEQNNFGIVCRYDSPALSDDFRFYYMIIGSDGYYGIGKVENGVNQLLGTEVLQYSDVIMQGGDVVNQIRGVCNGTTLTLFVNGQQLASVEDASITTGSVGLIAGTFETPGVDVLFDNFIVRRP
jgi:hypothetical protein